MIYDVLYKCENEIRKEMAASIVVCGGNTMIDNFVNRLIKE